MDFGNTPDKLTYLTRKRLYLTILDSPHSEGVMKTCTEIVLIFEDEGSVMSPTPGTPAPHVVVAVLTQGPKGFSWAFHGHSWAWAFMAFMGIHGHGHFIGKVFLGHSIGGGGPQFKALYRSSLNPPPDILRQAAGPPPD